MTARISWTTSVRFKKRSILRKKNRPTGQVLLELVLPGRENLFVDPLEPFAGTGGRKNDGNFHDYTLIVSLAGFQYIAFD